MIKADAYVSVTNLTTPCIVLFKDNQIYGMMSIHVFDRYRICDKFMTIN